MTNMLICELQIGPSCHHAVWYLRSIGNIASWADCLLTILVAKANSAFHPYGVGNEYQLRLGGKGVYGSFRLWMNA